MSEYWSATSGTALVFPKEEVRDFFTEFKRKRRPFRVGFIILDF